MTVRPPSSHRAVLLVGFMGSGKTTVGRLVAAELGWHFLDVDDMVEARAGRSIADIFESDGEQAFRRMEARATADALEGERRVVAPGGGWAAHPGRLAGVGPDVLTVWLAVSPRTAVARVRDDGTVRPLLEGPYGVARAEELLVERLPYYREARLHLDTEDASPERLAGVIVRTLRTGGAPG